VHYAQVNHHSQTLHGTADETLHNKAQKELLEENPKQILLTDQNLHQQKFLVESLHQNLQNRQNHQRQFLIHPH
jgi:hypothetical protein